MRNKLAPVKNVAHLSAAFEALSTRDAGIPGMGLVHGYTGAGKTTAITWLINKVGGVYARANATWTPSAMLGYLMGELGAVPVQRASAMLDFVQKNLAATRRPLFIDEADYLLHNLKMLEALRDIHDLSGQPVVLIGMEGIERKLIVRPQLARRISQWVEFKPSDEEDAAILAKTVCEVSIGDDLLQALHTQAKGSMGLMTVGLARIEALAKANRWSEVDAERWGNRQLFLSSPKAGRGY